jgi:hypothetical protein
VPGVELYSGDGGATPTTGLLLKHVLAQARASMRSVPAFLALADEALMEEFFRFDGLAIERLAACSLLESARVDVRRAWLTVGRASIAAGEVETVGAGSDDGVVASMRQAESVRFNLEQSEWTEQYTRIGRKGARLDAGAANVEWLKLPGNWMKRATLREVTLQGATPEDLRFRCTLPLRLRFPLGTVVQAHALMSRPDLNGASGTVAKHDEAKGRVGVAFASEAAQPLSLKASNLRMVL